MPKTVVAETVTLYEMEQRFGLQQIEDAQFFPEWCENLAVLTQEEQQCLERVKAIWKIPLRWRSSLPSSIWQGFTCHRSM